MCLSLLDSLGEAHVLTALNHQGVGGENSITVMLQMPLLRVGVVKSCRALLCLPCLAASWLTS